MKAYSTDLGEKPLAAVDRGVPRQQVAHDFDLDPSTIKRWLRLRRDTGSVAPRPIPGRPARLKPQLDAGLEAQIRATPDATIAEHCATWEAAIGQRVSPATMRRAVQRLGWTRKNKSLSASERDEAARADWREATASLLAERLVFVDECGTHLAHTRVRLCAAP